MNKDPAESHMVHLGSVAGSRSRAGDQYDGEAAGFRVGGAVAEDSVQNAPGLGLLAFSYLL